MKTMSFDFNSRRSMISARRGMVGASNPLAAQAGLNILRQGGNAADAAVATSAMMNVMDPGLLRGRRRLLRPLLRRGDQADHRLEWQRARALAALNAGDGSRAWAGRK